MRFASLFSGIEAASAAWNPLGWECVFVAEIEKFPSAVLRHHYPDVPNLGDITKITEQQMIEAGRIDLMVGGFPCQDLSVAGKRKGLKNEDGSATRSGLFFDAMRLVGFARQHCGLRWLVVENVPGLYSSNAGRDFAEVVGAMVGCGFDVPRDGWRSAGCAAGPGGVVEWRCLDAQYFGLAQRRKRVFFVADFGYWTNRPPVLFERESLRGHPAPSREARKDVAGTISSRTTGGGGLGTDFDFDGGLVQAAVKVNPVSFAQNTRDEVRLIGRDGAIAGALASETGMKQQTYVAFGGNNTAGPINVSTSLSAHAGPHGHCDFESETFIVGTLMANGKAAGSATQQDAEQNMLIAHTLRADGFDASEDGTGRGTPLVPMAFPSTMSGTQCAKTENLAPAIGALNQTAVSVALRGREGGATAEMGGDLSAAQRGAGGGGDKAHVLLHAVRRLTPEECEKLQGFLPGYTAIPYRGKIAADGPRYRALGNSMAVPVMRKIGERIAMMEALID